MQAPSGPLVLRQPSVVIGFGRNLTRARGTQSSSAGGAYAGRCVEMASRAVGTPPLQSSRRQEYESLRLQAHIVSPTDDPFLHEPIDQRLLQQYGISAVMGRDCFHVLLRALRESRRRSKDR